MANRRSPIIAPDAPGQHPLVAQALREKRRLGGIYRDVYRVMEPQCHGIGKTRKQQVRVYLTEGDSKNHPERLFDVDELHDLRLLDEHFYKPGPNYRFNDSDFIVSFQQLPEDFGGQGKHAK